jgi:hypothetical protein
MSVVGAILAAVLLLPLCAALAGPARAQEAVDLQLVLAIDGSGSIDEEELALQIGGIATAFRDAEVQAAIAAGPLQRIAVAAIIWAEANLPKDTLPWHLVQDRDSAERFAAAVAGFRRKVAIGGTGIGKAIVTAVRLIDRSGYTSGRRVVDLSGDGEETAFRDYSVPVDQARAVAASRGVTVNGLAILSDEPELDVYYRRSVIVGPGAFVMTAGSFQDFARAVRLKLLREIEDRPLISRWLPPGWPGRDGLGSSARKG